MCFGVKKILDGYATVVAKKGVGRSDTGAIGVRPPQHMRESLRKLAADLDYSEGQLLYRCAEAVITMVDAPAPMMPRLVQRARLLRQHGVTADSPERPFPNHLTLEEPPPAGSGSSSAEGHTRKSKSERSQSARESNHNSEPVA
jgi:hypothetical protein